jgi:glycosyltransferase involved in cell wall biosynthesis
MRFMALLSIVIPFHNEADSLPALVAGLRSSLPASAVEFLFVDDGSTDGSEVLIKSAVSEDPRFRLIRLARRFGQTAALSAGLERVRGDVVVTLDADGQNDPEDIPRLVAALDGGAEVACGWRWNRQDPFLSRRLPSLLANRLISWVTGVRLHDYGCTLKAYRRSALKDVRLYGDMHRLIPVWCAWKGAKLVEVEVTHHPRRHGCSKYGLGRTFRVLLDLLTAKFFLSYLSSPSHALGGLGFLLFAAAFGAGLFPILDKFFFHAWGHLRIPFMIFSVFLGLMGMQFLALGVLAEILVRIYYENRNERPYRVLSVYPDS